MMTDEERAKWLILEHCRMINDGNVEDLLQLYAEDCTFEDPVGNGKQHGLHALSQRAAAAVFSGAFEDAAAPVASMDGQWASVPMVSTFNYLPLAGPAMAESGLLPATPPDNPAEKMIQVKMVMTIHVNEVGLVDRMMALYGSSDVSVIDRK
ncbi:nuclear transport factor 2 family protein [Streptomyces sp. NK08204]|uniref:nuclear transport factor 2 family protein n=1 Tax=Streptomyces sp. NK08204 TaxID=2873260 RepID=UPI001CEC3969|nr:nuclear transport factor 2 family protein [Streptomyces sp. NK08204]